VRQLVFIDETGLNTTMARRHGRSLIGQRCLGAIPHGHWQTSTLIAALRHESVEAPFLIEGPMDAEVFTVYLEQVLGPQLREGDTLILDNLSTHKIQNVGRWLAARGVRVRYLPPYSPDLNPIELAFAKLKAHLRQTAARTLENLHSALATALDSFSPNHCRAFFRHAQYASI
jgi:transposase